MVALGLVTGLAASALVGLLRLVEHIAYGYRKGPFLDGVAAAAGWRHVAALLLAAFIVAAGTSCWAGCRPRVGRRCQRRCGCRGGQLAFIPAMARALLSIVTVGLGVSLGREAAPAVGGRGDCELAV